MHKVSSRSLAALQRAHEQAQQAQAALQFVLVTMQDAYDLPSPIVGFDVESCSVTCAPVAEEDAAPSA